MNCLLPYDRKLWAVEFLCDSFCLSTKTLSNTLYSLGNFRAQPLVPYDLEGYSVGYIIREEHFLHSPFMKDTKVEQ